MQYHILSLLKTDRLSEDLWDPRNGVARITPEGIEGYAGCSVGRVTLSVSLEQGPVEAPVGFDESIVLHGFSTDHQNLTVFSWSEEYEKVVLPESFLDKQLTVRWSAKNRDVSSSAPESPPFEAHHVAIWRT
ncbi:MULTISPECIES: hypothetical protein [unclassified Rathayibacter]|uniref:hypothetical protein n=1 Tax=unclassified Rathayibacter TaxID=2609250 RepID=UPI0012E75B77|nr:MULTISPECIES: hypothetical protein [unclassified Rathayibacter]